MYLELRSWNGNWFEGQPAAETISFRLGASGRRPGRRPEHPARQTPAPANATAGAGSGTGPGQASPGPGPGSGGDIVLPDGF